ncbi:MAG: hypothetical protein ACOWWR_06850 [Eubacteriales bacterium]
MKKKMILISLTIFILIQFMLHTNIAINAVMEGIKLWFYNVLPSLFPFMIFSSILFQLDTAYFLQRFFNGFMIKFFNVSGSGTLPTFMGYISGYPLGSKLVCDLKKEGYITLKEGYKLLALSSATGPAFIIGIVSLQMFGNKFIIPILLLANYLGAIANELFLKRVYKEKISLNKLIKKPYKNFSNILNDAIMTSITSSLKICGYIVFFNLIIRYLDSFGLFSSMTNTISSLISITHISEQLIKGTLYGFFEITLGIYTISQCNDPLILKVALTSLLIAWSGFSIHLQTNSFLMETDLRFSKYLFGKLTQGIFSLLISIAAFLIIKPPVLAVFRDHTMFKFVQSYYLYSYCFIIIVIITYIILKILMNQGIIKRL